MQSMTLIIFCLIFLAVALSILATHIAIIDEHIDQKQRKLQILLIWSLPMIGAFIVIHFAIENQSDVIDKLLIPSFFKKMMRRNKNNKLSRYNAQKDHGIDHSTLGGGGD